MEFFWGSTCWMNTTANHPVLLQCSPDDFPGTLSWIPRNEKGLPLEMYFSVSRKPWLRSSKWLFPTFCLLLHPTLLAFQYPLASSHRIYIDRHLPGCICRKPVFCCWGFLSEPYLWLLLSFFSWPTTGPPRQCDIRVRSTSQRNHREGKGWAMTNCAEYVSISLIYFSDFFGTLSHFYMYIHHTDKIW